MRKISSCYLARALCGSSSRGFAIIMVLGSLALLVVLVLMFLESIRNEGLSASIYAGQLEARRGASSALELVMSQIQEASEDKEGVWTSQPGLIRVHHKGGSQTVYKLYSARPQTMKSKDYSPGEDYFLGKKDDGNIIDLNQPIFFKGHKIYPIIDPEVYSGGKSLVDGFENTLGGSEESFQMNVQWLYLLDDGRMVTQGALEKEHPPISRIAFWVDDESCKVNINTASEGSYWDVPRTDSREDVDYSLNIPALNEFQRYPGHPAMTSLSPILNGDLLGGEFKQQGIDYQKLIYDLIPRISEGGSKGGTRTPSESIKVDSDRLFGFVDEIVFKTNSDPSKQEIGVINPEKVPLLSFFLTANSRSPEETSFSTPRVSIWPLHTDENKWRPSEQMLDFCSNLNEYYYGFQREKATDAEFDFKNIPRNQEIYSYLKSNFANIPPHLQGSLKNSWGIDADQNLTEIFDYIRSGPGLQSPVLKDSYTPYLLKTTRQKSATGSVTPIIINDTKGLGRCLTISQVGILMTSWSGLPTTTKIASSVVVQFFNPAQGFTGYVPQGLKMRVTGLNNLKLGGQSLFGAPNQSGWHPFGGGFREIADECFLGGFLGLSTAFCTEVKDGGSAPMIGYTGYETVTALPEWHGAESGTVVVDTTVPLGFSGGDLTVEIQDKNSGITIQKVSVNIPAATVNMPQVNVCTAIAQPGWNDIPGWSWYYKMFYYPSYAFSPLSPIAGVNYNVIRSVILKSSGKARGDFRMLAGRRGTTPSDQIDDTFFEAPTNTVGSMQHDFKAPLTYEGVINVHYYPNSSDELRNGEGRLVANANYDTGVYSPNYRPQVNGNLNGAVMNEGYPGDWDTGIANFGDGPYINKPDESFFIKNNGAYDSTVSYSADLSVRGAHYMRWYGNSDSEAIAASGDPETWYSPNRQLPSAVMLGSLPSGVKRLKPWQTFLFSPNSAADCDRGARVHPGWGNGVPDHLLLDYFRMPIAEPYAISDPLSTAGKININFEIIPFSHLKRASGIYALLKAVKLPNIPLSEAPVYKCGRVQQTSYRSSINLAATVQSFEERFKSPIGAYRTDSEVCEVFLYPQGLDYSADKSSIYNWWKTRSLTGDNLREQPYMSIYPRITTRSNVYTMHVWTQALKKSNNTNPQRWEQGKDRVMGEYRGSYTLERYIDPQNEDLPDFSKPTDKRLSDYYQFRVIQSKTITP